MALVPLAEAQARVRGAVSPLPTVTSSIDDALGCVLAAPVVAREPVPPFANTAMDGYAVRAQDTAGAPLQLRVVGELPAGRDPSGLHVGEGEAIRIMTGAPMPEGADAVVMVERTRLAGDLVEVEVEGLGRLTNHVVTGPVPVRTDVGAQPTESEEVVSTALGGDWEYRGIRTPSKDLYPSLVEEK